MCRTVYNSPRHRMGGTCGNIQTPVREMPPSNLNQVIGNPKGYTLWIP